MYLILMRYIRDLSESTILTLEQGFRYGPTPRFRLRCQAILLSYQGKQIKELAMMYDVDRYTITNWYNGWESKGIVGLMDGLRSGRPRKLDTDNQAHVDRVKTLVAKESQQLDRVRAQLQEELSVDLSRKTLKRFLKSLVTDGSVLEYQFKSTKIKPTTKTDPNDSNN